MEKALPTASATSMHLRMHVRTSVVQENPNMNMLLMCTQQQESTDTQPANSAQSLICGMDAKWCCK